MATKTNTKNKKTTTRVRKRVSKNISNGQVHIKTSFNNTIVTFSDAEGNVISWCSSGKLGLKAQRKAHLLLLKHALKRLQRWQKNMASTLLKFMLKAQAAEERLQSGLFKIVNSM